MVTTHRRIIYWVLSVFLLALNCAVLGGCGPRPQVAVQPDFRLPAELDTVYVVPFISTLVPPEVEQTVFNDFVDILNENRNKAGVGQFEIIKGELKDVDQAWLHKQTYLGGELWSYIENAGCCRTELRIRSRVTLTEPGKNAATFELFVPMEGFFDHDQSTLDKERVKLAKRLARELADRVIVAISSRK